MRQTIPILLLLTAALNLFAQKPTTYSLSSPDNKISITVAAGQNLSWSVTHGAQNVLVPSTIALTLEDGEVLAKNPGVVSAKQTSANEIIRTVAYKKDVVQNRYNQLTLTCKGGFGVVFRAYNGAAAYRFFTTRPDSLTIRSELAEFNFEKNYTAYIPHMSGLRDGEHYSGAFEEFYTETPLSKFNKDTLGYLPLLVQLDAGKKAVLLEADVQDYPCMFVQNNQRSGNGIKAAFAPYPAEEKLGGYNRWNLMVTQRSGYIARVSGTRNFPWRAVVVSETDKELLNNDLVQCLSEPSRIDDPSWIKPGKVAWDWWNDWNITHVDFKAGINTETYKYYLDFAAANQLEYIILDEGWSNVWDLKKVNPAVDLKELVAYGKQKNVGLILWSTQYAISLDPDALCSKYAAMGIKGFKIDFLDRNDQKTIEFCYDLAATAAKHHLLLDFHGVFPPQGLQRTWPNVVNFEGVRGQEYMKWSADDRVPRHNVSLPYIRMMAGPMDYTPGAMRNATRYHAAINNSLPMSLGTRCHQLAMYVVFEAPLQMLSDNPGAYQKEKECTGFIASVPTAFNETIALDGMLGEYAVLARKKDNVWYIGGMNNWIERELSLDFSFLGPGNFTAEIFTDGINAHRDATDYKKEAVSLDAMQKRTIRLAPGGGFVMIISGKE